jgi:hypothetical protein
MNDDDGLGKAIRVIHARIKETGPWNIGDKEAFVFNDAVAIVSMNEGRELKIDIVAGVPHKHDMTLDLLEPKR